MDPGGTTGTERLPLLPNVDRIFDAFVRNANAVSGQARTTLGAPPESEEYDFLSQKTALAELVPLEAQDDAHPALDVPDLREAMAKVAEEVVTSQGSVFSRTEDLDDDGGHYEDAPTHALAPRFVEAKILGERPSGSAAGGTAVTPFDPDSFEKPLPGSRAADDVPDPGFHTQKNEAVRVVPDVASVKPPAPPVRERSEDGQIPARELERAMEDMGVLLRYGHDEEVAKRLFDLRRQYPRDLLLLRRVAEFHLESGSKDLARETLFDLASALFKRRNVTGMKAALEQILVLFPNDARAHKLVGLLEQR